MVFEDLLWAILGAGFFVGIAYVRSELRTYRAFQGLHVARLAQQRSLWVTEMPLAAASPSDTTEAIAALMS